MILAITALASLAGFTFGYLHAAHRWYRLALENERHRQTIAALEVELEHARQRGLVLPHLYRLALGKGPVGIATRTMSWN